MNIDLKEIREDTCYHEATHAVFNYYANLTIRYVRVTAELDAICVSAQPVEPYPRQAMDYAVGLFAAEYAVYHMRGEVIPSKTFEEFVADAEAAIEEAESMGYDPDVPQADDVSALRLLRRAASWRDNPWGDLEACYEAACSTAAQDLELQWPEIQALAERLSETGYLDGDECVRIIEAAQKTLSSESSPKSS